MESQSVSIRGIYVVVVDRHIHYVVWIVLCFCRLFCANQFVCRHWKEHVQCVQLAARAQLYMVAVAFF